MEKIVHTKDIRYSIKFLWKEGEVYGVDYQVVEIESHVEGDNGPEEVIYYNEERSFDDAYKADPICNGYIKWDGCMEIHDMNVHLCYWGTQLQCMIDTIYEQAEQIMGIKYERKWRY
jgi:hypothetical protein